MKIIVIINLTFVSALVVAGSKNFEAIDGQNATISFDIDEVEKADQVKIIFKDKKGYSVLLAQEPWVYDDPPEPGVTLILGKGCLSLIIQNISISRSGLYKARAFTGKKVCEETATLVVNKALVSSTTSPPHSSSSPKPPRSSGLQWIVIVISLVIVVSGGVYFWKQRRIPCFQKKELGTSSSDCVSVTMNCGENAEDLLTET